MRRVLVSQLLVHVLAMAAGSALILNESSWLEQAAAVAIFTVGASPFYAFASALVATRVSRIHSVAVVSATSTLIVGTSLIVVSSLLEPTGVFEISALAGVTAGLSEAVGTREQGRVALRGLMSLLGPLIAVVATTLACQIGPSDAEVAELIGIEVPDGAEIMSSGCEVLLDGFERCELSFLAPAGSELALRRSWRDGRPKGCVDGRDCVRQLRISNAGGLIRVVARYGADDIPGI